MTDNSETPASTGSQRDVSSRSTTKRVRRMKNAAAVETKEPMGKAPARKRAGGNVLTQPASGIEATDTAAVSRAAVKSKRHAKPAPGPSAQPAAAGANAPQDDSPGPQSSDNEAPQRDIPPAERRDMIQRIAYFRAEWRGWTPGGELDDWLHAEREVDAMLRGDRHT